MRVALYAKHEFSQTKNGTFPNLFRSLSFIWPFFAKTGVPSKQKALLLRSSSSSLFFSCFFSTRHVSSLPTAIPEHPNDTMACDSKCQAQILANAKKEEETENIVIAITFILIICLVYITGFIVWFWCNRIPEGGISAVQQTDRVALKSTLTANGGHLSHSKVSRKWASNGLEKPKYKREAATTFS